MTAILATVTLCSIIVAIIATQADKQEQNYKKAIITQHQCIKLMDEHIEKIEDEKAQMHKIVLIAQHMVEIDGRYRIQINHN